MNIYSLTAASLEGEPVSLSEYAGKVSLIVNVASECGYTPQYAGLQELQSAFSSQGFNVLGFPSNDFGAQEPREARQIREFCTTEFDVTFPLFAKIQVTPGEGQSPVFSMLEQMTGTLPEWNFGKYIVSRDGTVARYFPSDVSPGSEPMVNTIREALAS